MLISRDPERGTFYVQCRYKDWTGEPRKKTKRGFKTEKEAHKWEDELLAMRTCNGLEYSQTYLHSICNQLSAMLNHAVRYYGLTVNPMAKVGKIGSKQADKMSF